MGRDLLRLTFHRWNQFPNWRTSAVVWSREGCSLQSFFPKHPSHNWMLHLLSTQIYEGSPQILSDPTAKIRPWDSCSWCCLLPFLSFLRIVYCFSLVYGSSNYLFFKCVFRFYVSIRRTQSKEWLPIEKSASNSDILCKSLCENQHCE